MAQNAKRRKLNPPKPNQLFRTKMLTLPPFFCEQERNEAMNEIEFGYSNKNIDKTRTAVLLKCGHNSKATLSVIPDEDTIVIPPQMQIAKLNQQNELQARKFASYFIDYLKKMK